MPAIGDQVAALEHDHTAALAQIDTLTAQLAAVTSAHADLTKQHAAVTADNAALSKYADEIRTLVENVATSALNMLKAARAPVTPTAAPEAPPAPVGVLLSTADLLPTPAPVVAAASLTATDVAVLKAAAPGQIVQTDSGDAQPAPVPPAAPVASMAEALAHVPAAIAADVKAVAEKVAEVPGAVNRMLHHSSASSAPPVTSIRKPVDMTMVVEHEDGLPIFLRRDTVFHRMARGIDA